MTRKAVAFRFPAIILSLIALFAFSAPNTAYAATTTISGKPSAFYLVQGAYYASGAVLAQNVPNSLYHVNILISDESRLRVDWTVKIDSEYMLVKQLLDGGVGNPDTMVVERAVDGSAAANHSSGAMIKTQTATIEIWANQVTDPWGLGSFEISVALPAGVQYVKMTAQTSWLTSTGRMEWCTGPVQYGNSWRLSCFTTGDPGEPSPLGPKGSGLIAKIMVLPPQQPGTFVLSLAGSRLLNITGGEIPSNKQNPVIRTLECPDTNWDGFVDSYDLYLIAKNTGDQGQDSGATLVAATDASQTSMQISDQTLLAAGDTISIDVEQMTVTALEEGTPDLMTVVRRINYTPGSVHEAGEHIYRGTADGNGDGKKGYTRPRDVNVDGWIDSGDLGIVARNLSFMCPEG